MIKTYYKLNVGDLVKAHWPMYIFNGNKNILISWWYGEITNFSDDMYTILYNKEIVEKEIGCVPTTNIIRVSKYCVFPLEDIVGG